MAKEYTISNIPLIDLYALATVVGVTSQAPYTPPELVATIAYDVADAMMAERERRLGKE